ncbi:ankyrin repeat domain-containing protein [Deefgea sp. CFH1-16]|uniref:ankyrin repeat domain-containing protein n=1 Tax=Deefgea sp. CFH1-16 TaxID=2675457 RepID=UPI0015F47F76|nr:ankyrin repeat domain-containing protein [Deefgea sp. CFH1-16]MBM5575366.1 hypothetical protein [Deefgea sp. CFH1-16]
MFDIFQAVRCGEVESVQAAIKQGADVNMLNKHGENLLIHAIAWKQKDAVELLIKLGIDINRQSKKGRSALHVAAETKQHDIVELLLNSGAEVAALDDLNREALWYASWLPKGDYTSVELLLKFGSNPLHCDMNNNSPLSFSREVCDFELQKKFEDYLGVRKSMGSDSIDF